MNLSERMYSMFDEMLTVVFGIPLEDVKKFKNTRTRHSLQSFMQMKIWDVLTEEQFKSLHAVLHTESIESFVKMANHMNKELHEKTKKERRK
jgi:hypothetical protein